MTTHLEWLASIRTVDRVFAIRQTHRRVKPGDFALKIAVNKHVGVGDGPMDVITVVQYANTRADLRRVYRMRLVSMLHNAHNGHCARS